MVRHTGLDVTVDASDHRRASGHLSRQGPGALRWALFEAGKCASRPTSPDYAYYQAVKKAHDGKLAAIAMARTLARRCYHTLRSLDLDVVYTTPKDAMPKNLRPRQSDSTVGTARHGHQGLAVSFCHAHAPQHPCWTAL